MSAHTPGPWAVQLTDGVADMVHASAEHNNFGTIVDLDGSEFDYDMSLANARLIAAAPELLEALKRSLSWLSSYPGGGATKVYEQAREAIDKAKGGKP